MTSPGSHSAGSVFLNVIPSFKNVQRGMEREAENIGAKAGEKAGEKFSEEFSKTAGKGPGPTFEQQAGEAGKKAGEKFAGDFRNSVDRVLTGTRSDIGKGISKDLDRVFDQLSKLKDAKVGVNFTAQEALSELARLEGALRNLQKNTRLDLEVRSNATQAVKRISREINRLRPEVVVDVQVNQGAFNRRLQTLIADANAALPDIKLKVNSSEADKKLAAVKAKLAVLGNAKIGIDITTREAYTQLAALQATLKLIARDVKVDLDIRSNAAEAGALLTRELERISKLDPPKVKVQVIAADEGAFASHIKASIAKANASLPAIQIRADSSDAEKEVVRIKAALASLGEKRIGIDISAERAQAEVILLQSQLNRLAKTSPNIQIKTDANRARHELDEVGRAAKRAASSADQGAVAFRAFNGVLLTAVTIGPLLIPILAGIAAGMIGLLVVLLPLVAALGVLALGLGGIAGAFTAVSDVERNAAEDARTAASTMRNAANSVRDATTSLTRAREDAARAAVDSAQRIQDAERDLADAQREAIDVQNDLIEARQRASDQQEDLALRARGGVLAERQGVIDVFQATVTNTNTQADPAATNLEKEQASINLAQAQLQLEQIRIENGRLGEQVAETTEAGIEGSEEVVQAQRAQEDAQRRIEDATRDVQRAYVEQARSAVDSQQAIQDATLRLADAQADYADAVYETQVLGSSSVQKLREEMEGLGPAAQRFVGYLQSLRPYFAELRLAAQEGFLPGLQAGMESFMVSTGPALLEFVGIISVALGDLAQRAGEAFGNPVWQEFFATMTAFAPIFIEQFGQIFGNIFEGIASLFVAFAPFTEELGGGLIGLTERFADWAASLKDSEGFQQFLDYLRETLPEVGEFLGAVIGALWNLGVALAPYAAGLLDVVTGFFGWIAAMDPDLLFGIAVAILAIFTAFQLLVGISSLVKIFMVIAFSPFATAALAVGIVIGALVLLGAAFVILWTKSETFRNIVTGVWEAIMDVVGVVVDWFVKNVAPHLEKVWADIADGVSYMWHNVVGPIFEIFGNVVSVVFALIAWTWEHILAPVFSAIIEVVSFMWDFIVQPIFSLIGLAFSAMATIISAVYYGLIYPVIAAFGAVFTWLWDVVIEPIVGWISEKWDEFAEAWNKVYDEKIKPIFTWFGEKLGELRDVFRAIVDEIGVIWNEIIAVAKIPVVFVIDTIINDGIIAGVNGIIDFFGGDPHTIPDIPPPAGAASWDTWATGGRIPGYSPTKTADNIPAWLTAGEFVQPVNTVDYYGEDVMELIRKRKIPREALALYSEGGMTGYADGGLVNGRYGFAAGGPTWQNLWEIVQSAFASTGVRKTSDYRPGDPGYHGAGQAIDFAARMPYPQPGAAEQMLVYNRYIGMKYPNATELIHANATGDSINLRLGRPHQYSQETLATHFNHVHWAVADLDAGLVATNISAFDWNGYIGFSDPIEWLLDIVSDGFSGVLDWLDSPVGQMIRNVPNFLIEVAGDAIVELMNAAAGLFTAEGSGGLNGTVEQNMETVRNAARPRGWDTGYQWDAIDAIVQAESGWNANAQNPNSTAYGLFQFLDSTWATVGYTKSSSPQVQAAAGMEYIDQRYGSPHYAKLFRDSHGWYSEGGVVGADGDSAPPISVSLYDDGGKLPPGLSLILNATGKPESVFNDDQLQELTQARGPEALVGGDITFPIMDTNSPVAVADELMFRLRRLKTAGKYADAINV